MMTTNKEDQHDVAISLLHLKDARLLAPLLASYT